MKRTTIYTAAAVLTGGCVLLHAQFATFDAAQELHALKQIANDIEKLRRLDQQILTATHQYDQMVYNAKSLPSQVRGTWAGIGNRIVTTWTSPNYYGETGAWNAALMNGTGGMTGWRNSTIALKRDPFIAGSQMGTSRNMADYSTVNTADAAGANALETVGGNRAQQRQMDTSISSLAGAINDDSAGMNSEVQQLNLANAAALQQLRMQQATNNALTALLEQQSINTKIQRDSLAEYQNFITEKNRYVTTENFSWGGDAAAAFHHGLQLQ